jgi:tetratricopeptide (TPR) repeat protein
LIRSPRLRRQWKLYDDQEYQRAFDETRALLVRLAGEDRRDAWRLLGLCCQRLKQYREAAEWFRRACEGSDEANDWLNVAVVHVQQGEVESGAEAFEQVRLCQQAARYRQVPGFYLQLYWYASALSDSDDHSRLPGLIDELAAAYRRLQRTDSAFLLSRGMPFLSSFLALVVGHFDHEEKQEEGIAWLQVLGQALDAGGQKQVAEAVERLRVAGDG